MEHAIELSWKSIQKMIDGFFQHLPNLIIGLLVLWLFIQSAAIFSDIVVKVCDRAKLDKTLSLALGSLTSFGIYLLGILVAATIILPSFSPGHLIAGLGITSVAIGFAFQDILRNFFAGLLILWQKPFRIGDEVKSGAFEGTVELIDIRSTRLRTATGEVVIVPNGNIYTEPVVVYTAYGRRQVHVSVKIEGKKDIDETRKRLMDILISTEGVEKEPPPKALVTAIDAGSATFDVSFWCAPQREQQAIVGDRVSSHIKTKIYGADVTEEAAAKSD